MWIDVVLALLFVISTVMGLRKGFAETCIHTVGWLLSLVLAFVWLKPAKEFLLSHTDLFATIYNGVSSRVRLGDGEGLLSGMPPILQERFSNPLKIMTENAVSQLSDLFFGIVAFLLLILACKLLLRIITLFFRKQKDEDTIIGFADRLFGTVLGVVQGVLLVYLFLALLVPVSSVLSPELVTKGLEEAMLAPSLYDNNLIFLILHDIF